MTRQQFLEKAKSEFELIVAQQQIRNVVMMARQGMSADDIADFVEFANERNAAAVISGLRQVERIIDRHLRGDNSTESGPQWLEQLLDADVRAYDTAADAHQGTREQ